MLARRFAFPSEIKGRTDFTENRVTESGKTEWSSSSFSPACVNGGVYMRVRNKRIFCRLFFSWFTLHPRQWPSRIFCSLSAAAPHGFCFPLALRIYNWREEKRIKRGERIGWSNNIRRIVFSLSLSLRPRNKNFSVRFVSLKITIFKFQKSVRTGTSRHILRTVGLLE